MLRQHAALVLSILTAQVVRQGGKLGLEQGQERAERLFLAAVRRGGDEDQVAITVAREPLEELVPQVPAG